MAKPGLVDLKYSKAELKEEAQEAKIGYSQQPYPYGLCIRLESDELEKLGITEMPQVGGEIHFMAIAKVTGVNQSAYEGQDGESCVSLQITMMQVLMTESADEEKGEKETPDSEAKESRSVMSYYKAK